MCPLNKYHLQILSISCKRMEKKNKQQKTNMILNSKLHIHRAVNSMGTLVPVRDCFIQHTDGVNT